jgi:signal transduction histidine kinase
MPATDVTTSSSGDVLVVDDAPANLQLLFGMLRHHGYRVRPVPSGRLALDVAAVEPPDVVLLDVNMPEMDGYEVCRRFKETERLRHIPIIFVSALSEPFDKVQAFAAGGVDYVTKPFQLEEVRVRLETHLALCRARAELERKNAALAVANQRLRALEEMRNALSSAIVHDLKSPLSALIASNQYLLGVNGVDGITGEAREVLEEMSASGHGLHRIVLNLLDISRLEDAHLTPRRTEGELGAIVEDARAGTQLTTRMTGHVLDIDADATARVSVDPDLVTRVLENLLDNAVKYAPRGTTIRVVARGDATGGVTLRVEDRGKGVPEDQRERIFERYARLDRDAMVQSRTSRGLGLAFCKLAVEAHGGRIWVEDHEGGGAVFCASIPGA